MQSRGIEHVKVPPAAHAQNGRVERVHLTILNGVRTVAHSGLGAQFWAEAANYIAYTRNQRPADLSTLCQMTVGKTKKADLIICNHLAVKSSSIVTIAIPASLHPATKNVF